MEGEYFWLAVSGVSECRILQATSRLAVTFWKANVTPSVTEDYIKEASRRGDYFIKLTNAFKYTRWIANATHL